MQEESSSGVWWILIVHKGCCALWISKCRRTWSPCPILSAGKPRLDLSSWYLAQNPSQGFFIFISMGSTTGGNALVLFHMWDLQNITCPYLNCSVTLYNIFVLLKIDQVKWLVKYVEWHQLIARRGQEEGIKCISSTWCHRIPEESQKKMVRLYLPC